MLRQKTQDAKKALVAKRDAGVVKSKEAVEQAMKDLEQGLDAKEENRKRKREQQEQEGENREHEGRTVVIDAKMEACLLGEYSEERMEDMYDCKAKKSYLQSEIDMK